MSEAEILELISLARDSAGFHAMNYIAVMFAYVIAAYAVGDKLSRFQVISITALYAIFSPFPCIYSYEAVAEHKRLMLEYLSRFESTRSLPIFLEYSEVTLYALFGGTWLISVAFMYQARHAARQSNSKAPPNKAVEADT